MIIKLYRSAVNGKKLRRAVGRLSDSSFVEEYTDSHYSGIRATEFDRLYKDRVIGTNRWRGKASKEGTEMFAVKNAKNLSDHFRRSFDGEITHSGLSFGSYNKDGESQSYLRVAFCDKMFNSMVDSVYNSTVNCIDTAPWWGYQRSERTIGAALTKLILDEKVFREELFVSSRVGYVEEDIDKGINLAARKQSICDKYKLRDDDFVGSYCLHPGFIRDQVETSRTNLGLDTIDLVYLHNPETWRAEKAMETLEELRREGKITYYGMSTYAGLRVDHRHPAYISLDDILYAAKQAGGENHGFKYVCLPMNLMMTEPLLEKHQSRPKEKQEALNEVEFVSTLEKLNELQINAMISQPFLSGFLLQTPLPTSVFRSRYIPVKQLNLLRSLPFDCIKSVIVGQKSNRHTKINMQLAQTPLVDKNVLLDFLTTPKKRIFDSQLDDPLQP